MFKKYYIIVEDDDVNINYSLLAEDLLIYELD